MPWPSWSAILPDPGIAQAFEVLVSHVRATVKERLVGKIGRSTVKELRLMKRGQALLTATSPVIMPGSGRNKDIVPAQIL